MLILAQPTGLHVSAAAFFISRDCKTARLKMNLQECKFFDTFGRVDFLLSLNGGILISS